MGLEGIFGFSKTPEVENVVEQLSKGDEGFTIAKNIIDGAVRQKNKLAMGPQSPIIEALCLHGI